MHKKQLFVYSRTVFSEPNSGPKPTQIPTANTESTSLSISDHEMLGGEAGGLADAST